MKKSLKDASLASLGLVKDQLDNSKRFKLSHCENAHDNNDNDDNDDDTHPG